MEREGFVFQDAESAIPSWSSLNFGSEIQSNELNCFLTPDWQTPMDLIADPFDSPLSSMVSSPVASTRAGAITKEEFIANSGELELSPQSYIYSTNNSCYSTPLNSPPKLNNTAPMDRRIDTNFAPFSADPGFVDRAARFSRLGGGNEDFSPVNPAFGFDDSRFPYKMLSKCAKLTAVSSKTENLCGVSRSTLALESTELGDSREASSISEAKVLNNDRKRKPRTKELQTPANALPIPNLIKAVSAIEESRAKTSKSVESKENENAKEGNQEQNKVPEPLKDYIHVRARRGQATDSHSLAERVRREKISERMKLLQDLVPGCNKVTGKAVMLDEIINYVQSLQRQVEFLSMKLATISPEGELNMESLLSKDFSARHSQLPQSVYQLDSSLYGLQYQQQQFPINGFREASPQVSGAFWEDDLHSVVQMGVAQNQPENFHASAGQMKIEL